MLNVTAPGVQIVTAGVDWPAIAAGISAGVVGIVGILATLSQGKRAREAASSDLHRSLDATNKNLITTINAENERARLATKRQIYTKCLGSLSVLVQAWYDDVANRGQPAERQVASDSSASALIAAYNAVAEVQLTAPDHIGHLAVRALTTLMDAKRQGLDNFSWRESREPLLQAMQKDLSG
jgi:hypothetical protein